MVLLSWQNYISCLPSNPYAILVFSILTYPWHISRDHICGEWCSLGLRVSRPSKSCQSWVCCLIFLPVWVRGPDYLLLGTNKTRMCWGASSVSGTRNIAGCCQAVSWSKEEGDSTFRGRCWNSTCQGCPLFLGFNILPAWKNDRVDLKWIFHSLLIGSDPPQSAGFQEQVYGSAAPVVLDSVVHDQFLVSFTETNRFFWLAVSGGLLSWKPINVLMVGGWEKVLNLERGTEGTASSVWLGMVSQLDGGSMAGILGLPFSLTRETDLGLDSFYKKAFYLLFPRLSAGLVG